MKKITIIGASGHGKVVADIAALTGYEDISFLDDDESIDSCGPYKVVGKCEAFTELEGDVFVAIGNASIRRRLTEEVESEGRKIPVLIHPKAIISKDTQIGMGTVVAAGAIINPGAQIGKGCIVNTASSIDHDCNIGSYVHIAVGAHVAGSVNVGEGNWIGAGATIINNIDICPGCVIGAGATVINSIQEAGTYVGVPAERIRR